MSLVPQTDLRALIGRCAARGQTILVWDGDRFHAVKPPALRAFLEESTNPQAVPEANPRP